MSDLNWRLLDIGTNPISYNFAAEDVLIDYVAETRRPVFLLYRSEPSVSISYTQRHDDIDLDFAEDHGIELARRYTGGRGVYHNPETDLTWSFIFDPSEHFGIETEKSDNKSHNPTEVYKAAGKTSITILKELGIEAEIYKNNFIVVDENKITGFAQAINRDHGVVLVHGYLLEKRPDFETTFNLIKSENPSEMAKTAHSTTTNLDDLGVAYEDFVSCLESKFGEIGSLTKEEMARVKELQEKQYRNKEWTETGFGRTLLEKGECITGDQRETMGVTVIDRD